MSHRPETATETACGCFFWAAIAVIVVALKAIFWVASVRWAAR